MSEQGCPHEVKISHQVAEKDALIDEKSDVER